MKSTFYITQLRMIPFLCHVFAGFNQSYSFSGVGYFTLPYLVHAKAAHVIACEWNPYSVHALKKNLLLNNVSG